MWAETSPFVRHIASVVRTFANKAAEGGGAARRRRRRSRRREREAPPQSLVSRVACRQGQGSRQAFSVLSRLCTRELIEARPAEGYLRPASGSARLGTRLAPTRPHSLRNPRHRPHTRDTARTRYGGQRQKRLAEKTRVLSQQRIKVERVAAAGELCSLELSSRILGVVVHVVLGDVDDRGHVHGGRPRDCGLRSGQEGPW